jgi:hypothetical protein
MQCKIQPYKEFAIMSQKKDRWIQSAYTIYVEEPGDIVFRIEGIVFFDQFSSPELYCQDSRYNFLRTVLNRNSIDDLCKGVIYKDHHIELRPISGQIAVQEPFSHTQIPMILQLLQSQNPTQFWFLKVFQP